MANFLTKIFGTHSSHELKKIYPIADKVDALEEQFKKLTDDELRAKTDEFKQRYQNGETLDQLLPEAFATCREAAWPRTRYASLPCTDHRRYRPASGPYRRDEDR